MTSQEILQKVYKSKPFIQLYRRARTYVEYPDVMKEEKSEFNGILVGELWALVAENYLKQYPPAGEILFDSRKTFDFYDKKLYPRTEKIDHLFSRRALKGISIPDAMGFDSHNETVPLSLYEFTARQCHNGSDREYFFKKLKAYGSQIMYEPLLRTAQVKFVVPWDTEDYFIRDQAVVLSVPIRHDEFGKFVKQVISTYARFGPPLLGIAGNGVLSSYR